MGAMSPAARGAFVDPQRRRAQQGSYSSPKADLQPTSPSGSQSRCREQDGSVVFVPATDCTPVVDSESWTPELSANGFVGIYHHWHHGAHDHQLCMFIVCQTYLPAACLEFADAVRDSGIAECTAGMVQASEVPPPKLPFQRPKACADRFRKRAGGALAAHRVRPQPGPHHRGGFQQLSQKLHPTVTPHSHTTAPPLSSILCVTSASPFAAP